MLGQHLPAFMALALQPAECWGCDQLLPTQIMKFGEQRLLGTGLRISKRSYALSFDFLSFQTDGKKENME